MDDLQHARLMSLIAGMGAALAGDQSADFSPRAFMLRPPEDAEDEREPTPEETAAALKKAFGIRG